MNAKTRKRRTLTPEQQERSDAKHAAFKAVVEKIAAMTDAERADVSARMAGARTVEGRSLSSGNAVLVACQRADATIIGGFRQWLKQGRVVKKGEVGLMIWAQRLKAETGTSEAPATETKGSDHPGFIAVTVFDVSQTTALDADAERTAA